MHSISILITKGLNIIYDVIIIGAGPAGISTAVEAKNAGIQNVLLFEKGESHSLSIRKLYTDGKRVDAVYRGEKAECDGIMCIRDGNKESTLEILNQFISDYNLEIKYNSEVEKINKVDDLFNVKISNGEEFTTKTIVVAIGVFGRPNKPEYKIPTELKKNVLFDITSQSLQNKDVLVVGGGNSASEAAEFLVNQNNRVYLSYRKSEFTRMNEVNLKIIYELFESNSVLPMLNTNIKELAADRDKIRVNFFEREPLKVDKIVFQIGGTTPDNFLKALGIEFSNGEAAIRENFETNIPGLFLAGDLVANKKGTIIKAFNTGKKIVQEGICNDYVECELPGNEK